MVSVLGPPGFEIGCLQKALYKIGVRVVARMRNSVPSGVDS